MPPMLMDFVVAARTHPGVHHSSNVNFIIDVHNSSTYPTPATYQSSVTVNK